MRGKQFVVEELEILNKENDWKGEYWWAVVNTKRVEDSFECRNKEVADSLCDFLNKATDDFKWQIRRCEKWSARVKQLEKENELLRNQLERKTILLKVRTKHIDDRDKSFDELLNYLESFCYKSNIDGNYAKQEIINILNNWEIREYD